MKKEKRRERGERRGNRRYYYFVKVTVGFRQIGETRQGNFNLLHAAQLCERKIALHNILLEACAYVFSI